MSHKGRPAQWRPLRNEAEQRMKRLRKFMLKTGGKLTVKR